MKVVTNLCSVKCLTLLQMQAPGVNLQPDQLQQLIQAVGGGNGNRSSKRLTPFSSADPTDWIAWRTTFGRVAELQQWNDNQKRLQLLAAMEGLACRQVSTIDVDGMGWEEILNAYGNRFLPPAAGQLAREQFSAAKQWESEGITAWHTRLSELYGRAYPNGNLDTDRILIEKFVMGLNHATVLDRTWDTDPQTMQAALNTATTKLANVERVRRATGGGGRRGVMSLEVTGEEPRVAALGGECFHCKTTGHYRAECPLRSYPKEEAQRRANQRQQPGRGGGRGRGRGRGRGGRPFQRQGAGRGRQDDRQGGRQDGRDRTAGGRGIHAIEEEVENPMEYEEESGN